jgi:hypothetical protein
MPALIVDISVPRWSHTGLRTCRSCLSQLSLSREDRVDLERFRAHVSEGFLGGFLLQHAGLLSRKAKDKRMTELCRSYA